MLHRIKTLATLFLLCLAPAADAGGKKEDTPVISFHMETDATDNPKMITEVPIGGNQVKYFRRMSEITMKDVVAFGPFPDDLGGNTYGMALVLKPNAKRRLAASTAVNIDRWMIARVNGTVRDGVRIDKPVEDGVLVIWKGVTIEEINHLDKTLPRIGAEAAKEKNKENKED
ncbi:hypothetical protein OVA24_11970 [Luteolibacter sp. SL250]|uniref:hypothetical protein n=1 Tax=Luteolibacter sp. SL250 TaxID=2995170 RepID=UPI00226D4040|nr:hypothetical protein [Luteolibacter sp. SL250]WAC17954.1 hypothetical protein OVA24_11970 [Luteolibacter sp. SL250]